MTRGNTHLLGHLDFDARVVRISVEHDDAVRQHVRHISRFEFVRVAVHKALRELLHEAVDLLCLAWQPEAVQELPTTQEHSFKIRCSWW